VVTTVADLQHQIGKRAQAAAEPQRKLIGPPHAHWDAPCTDACYEAAEPQQQADASPLLDLVRQYGDAREAFRDSLHTDGFLGDVQQRATAAAEVFRRIAALVPAMPVQARDEDALPLWINGTGEVASGDEPNDDGPWRPLLVGGDPAPSDKQVFPAPPHPYERGPYQVDGSQACGICGSRRAAAVHRKAAADRHEQHVDGPCEPTWQEVGDHFLMQALGVERLDEVMPAIERLRDLIAQVMAELGVNRPEDVMGAIERLEWRRAQTATAVEEVADEPGGTASPEVQR